MGNTHAVRRIDELVLDCRDERDMNRKVELYNQIRKKLSYPSTLPVQSMMTDDYIDSALDNI